MICALVLSGCGPYSKAEKAQLRADGVYLRAGGVYSQAKDCAHTDSVKKDTDPAYLVNKFYALPKGYEPNDLESIASVCTVGDTGCNSDELYLRKEANSAFQKMVKAGKKAHVKIVAISGYRTYDYQLNLWTTNAQTYGQDYADAYFARAGQSEHNTGLAVDITFNDHPFNEIENYKGYNWILKNMHTYGFILRYPKDKEKVTRYNYESWHLRYVGKKVAKTCFEKNWTLEEYWGNQ